MLHADSSSAFHTTSTSVPAELPSPVTDSPQVIALSAVPTNTEPSPVLLATARVTVSSLSGRAQTVRALLDQGSEVSFITENLAQVLRLRRVRTLTTVTAIGGIRAVTSKAAAQINVTPRDRAGPTFTTIAYVMKALTKYSPRSSHFHGKWKHLSQLNLADDDPTGSDPIDLIIGADLYGSIMLNGIRKGSVGQPIAQNSHFGWVISGPTSTQTSGNRTIRAMHCSLEQELSRFWEVEELPYSVTLTSDEKKCEEHFLANHTRTQTGRYVVRLPFKEGPPIEIGQSYEIASRMLTATNRRLKSNPTLQSEYSAFLSEYEQFRHMEKVSDSFSPSSQSQVVYIPHHSVVRNSSTTTRVRVVFNASSVTTNGSSLNSHLLAGPKLQTNLFEVLLRWRQFQYVCSADIEKMYRQILIDPRDQDYQRILWNAEGQIVPQEYRLRIVTYGTASAPFLALRVIKQLLQDEGESFPLAVSTLRDNIYVDDVLFGADDVPLLRQTRDQVRALLLRGGFKLRKWTSNKSQCLSDIPHEECGLTENKIIESTEHVNILGLAWNPARDMFQFNVHLPEPPPTTKRKILSIIAKLFDPLGWLTPITIAAKIFMQQLWRLKLNWDDTLPQEMLTRWETISQRIASASGLQLARWFNQGSDTAHCELHGFADASSVAYAAVVYIRVTSISGTVSTAVLAGKSKVAPIKPMSIPRLELSAAVLLARLISSIQQALNLSNIKCYCWTDSTVVLAWLNKHPSNWKIFVSHRVTSVHTHVPNAQWRNVPTADNPADCASRGLLDYDLKAHSLWWFGPSWLKLEPSTWPNHVIRSSVTAQLEAKPACTHHAQPSKRWDLASRYSEWPTLIRVTAYIMRFINRCRVKTSASRGMLPTGTRALDAKECEKAKVFWLNTIQNEVFAEELKALRKGQSVSSRSPILSLHPFLDEDQLIRVGGRIENAPLPFSAKHQIILAPHPLVKMLVRHAHLRALHAGAQLTLATIRREYWILRSRTLVKADVHNCVSCTRERAAVPTQLMGYLPVPRVNAPTRAFLHCGVDYAGPIATRTTAGRGITSRKAYIAVFICLATKAIHLELVSSYATSAFLDAYTRFCARRGLPEVMYSDNGTTFIGADRELAKAYIASTRDPDFLNRTASDRVSWNFIPPHSPHFGGLWESGVRSVKHHLRRVISHHTLTFEELTTFLCKVEACLNSRPLSPLTDSPDDYESLIPGHFLIGSALTVSPEPSVFHLKENRLSRWQLVRQLNERFWKIWQTDYINTLQQRVKWRKVQPPIQVGMMVLIRNNTCLHASGS